MHAPLGFLSRIASTAACVTLLAACAATPRTVESDAAVRSVAVVSLLDEKAPIARIGLTVFNNETATLDQQGELNRLANQIVKKHLRDKRPNWVIKDSTITSQALLNKEKAGGIAWNSFTGNISNDLREIAQATGADLIFVVMDTNQENAPGRGVGIWFRALGSSSASKALVHAHVLLALVDKDGKELTRRGGASPVEVPASELGLTYDLSSLKDPEVSRRVSETLKKQLSASLELATTRMGY